MRPRRTVTISAPAKINLGLEILGKREDGYHDIRTVMAMIDLADTLHISEMGPAGRLTIAGVDGVPAEDNLIAKAIEVFAAETGVQSSYEVVVEKRIPSPGGLGGASSDAAATLLGLNLVHDSKLDTDDLTRLASRLGADVPFFLGSPVALASGTGTTLSRLPSFDGWVVVVIPVVEIEAKTPTLYRALQAEDFSDGSTIGCIAKTVEQGFIPNGDALRNAFERPMYELAPELRDMRKTMFDAGAAWVSLSGAGPAHFVIYAQESDARTLAASLDRALSAGTRIVVARLLRHRPVARLSEQ